jgi:hypothetical protein
MQGTARLQSMVDLLVAENAQEDGNTVLNEYSTKGMTVTVFSGKTIH